MTTAAILAIAVPILAMAVRALIEDIQAERRLKRERKRNDS